MITLEEFYDNFLQSILSDTESRGLLKSEAFFENVCEDLSRTGELTVNYSMSNYIKKGTELNGYDYDDERQLLSLIVHHYFQENTIQTLTQQNISTKFKRLKSYLQSASEGAYREYEETAEGYDGLYNIYCYLREKKVEAIRFIIITDGKMTRSVLSIDDDKFKDIKIEHRIIDIEYIYKVHLSEFTNRTFEVNVCVPFLKVNDKVAEYDSFLVIVDGNTLADIYDKYGQKLFEQNVRTFLQFRGNVNKGLRNTIEFNPKKFFSYNNGLTATASEVEFDEKGNITKIVDFQIVNGAQTTSAIYAAKRNYKLDISDVFVQMKLTIIKDNDDKNEVVSKISEYANTQNKVSKSDFFSNSPFHKEFKDYSNRIWVAATGGSQRRTHWFYERVRGGYLNEQTFLTPAEKKKFLLENPKGQLLDKTFLAKSENSWAQHPDIVAKGAQYSFSYFADTITDQLEKDDLTITEKYFKDAISRVILFRKVEKLISAAPWYNGGFRAQIVTYTIAYFSHFVEKKNRYFCFDEIWDTQDIPDDIVACLDSIALEVSEELTSPPEGYGNITQWCKQAKCWSIIKKLCIDVIVPEKYLMDKEEIKYVKGEEKKTKILDKGIEIQMFVIGVETKIWNTIRDYFSREENIRDISSTQRGVLESMCAGKLVPPTERQSKVLYETYLKAEGVGVLLD